MELTFQPYQLEFKFNAGTSRGILKEKITNIIKISDDQSGGFGLGEAGPLKGLSIDDRDDLSDFLETVKQKAIPLTVPDNEKEIYEIAEELAGHDFPSVRFALETAMLDLKHGGQRIIFQNDFSDGKEKIPINGLIWMGHMEDMLFQITEKVNAGFDCIKMKVGSLDFDKECDILHYIRNKYYEQDITIRVDANGAFKPDDVKDKLERLSKFDLHSIEQPIKPGQYELMAELCKNSPLKIALDEELIGIWQKHKKRELLEKIKPPYIILKPTLLGGIKATQEWIDLANEMKIGWWLTSALESNIGLNAISQYAGELKVENYQGLGTGQLYHNNFESPLRITKGHIEYKGNDWDFSNLDIV